MLFIFQNTKKYDIIKNEKHIKNWGREMKKISLLALSVFMLSANGALAAGPHIYANKITANNITAIQHSIMSNAMQTFEGTAAAALGGRAKLVKQTEDSKFLYGTTPMYGWPRLYGEYGDDDTAQRGRNGGDDDINELERTDNRPVLNSVWLNWQHVNDDVKFKGYDELSTNTDLISFGLAGGEAQRGIGISEWGIFGGYIGGDQENKFISIDERGGYVGLYTGYNIQLFNMSLAADFGTLYNNAEHQYGNDEFANMWAGAALNMTYNIALDNTFTIQPGVYAGYTWISGANYMSMSGDAVANQNFNSFEIAPEIRAIKHIGRGWFGFINFKYAFMMGHGGDVVVNGMKYDDLDMRDYAEYGIGIEKSIDRFNIALNLNRRDGGRAGWNGGFNVKYIF